MERPARDDRFLDLTAYAKDPTDGDWTDILLSAIRSGHRRIHLNDRRFGFAMSAAPSGRAITQPCELHFGPDHEVAWAGASRGPFKGSILAVRGAAGVSIDGPNFVGEPMLDVSGGRLANCHCFVVNTRLAEPVVVVDGGNGYRGGSGHRDGHFDYPVLEINYGAVPPREVGVVRFQVVGGKIVGGSVISPGVGYAERPRRNQAAALMLGAAFPSTSLFLMDCANPKVSNVRQIYGRGMIILSGGSGARILTGHARDIGSAGHGIQIGPTDDVIASGWDIKGVHGGIYHAAGISLIHPRPVTTEGLEDPVTSRVRITDNVVDDVNAGSCFDGVVCGLRDIRFERNTAIQRRTGGFFCMQIKLIRPSRDPENPGGGVRDVVYRDNRAIQNAPAGLAVDFQNNSDWDEFEVDFDRSNSIECTARSDKLFNKDGANCFGLRVHNLTGGTVAPTIRFAPVGVRSTGATRGVVFSPNIARCRIGILSDTGDGWPPITVRDAEIHASELGAFIRARGAHRFIDCKMIAHGYRLADRARIVSEGSGFGDGYWNVFATGSGSGLALRLHVEAGRIVAADLLAAGRDYLNGGAGEFLLDVPPSGPGDGGSGGVLAVMAEAGSVVAVRVAEAGQAYQSGGLGEFEPEFPEHARLIAVAHGGKIVEVRVAHCGWRFHRPPTLQIDPAAGGSGATIAIDLAGNSFGAYFAEAEGLEISGGLYSGAAGDIRFAGTPRAQPTEMGQALVDGAGPR